MNELKVTFAVLVLTLCAVINSMFCQPSLKQIVWKRGEKQVVQGKIEQTLTRQPGELCLLVNLKKTKIFITIPQIASLSKCNSGNQIKAEVKIYPIQPGISSYRGIYEYLLYRQGITARSWSDTEFECNGPEVAPALRLRIFEKVREKFGDTDQLSLIFAINFGAAELIGEGIKELFRDLGLSHALVVSGFHVGLVYALTFLFFDYLFSRSILLLKYLPSEFIAAPVALAVSSYFSFFSGCAMPCLRAMLFLFVTAFYKIIGSSASSLHRVLITFSIILLLRPSSFFDLSLLLSVAAVIGVLCGLRFQSLTRSYATSFNRLFGAFAINFFAWAFTLPICLIFFGQVFPYSPVINFLLLPLITVFFSFIGGAGLIMSSLGFSCLNHLFVIILLVLGHFLSGIWEIREFFAFHAEILEFNHAVISATIVSLLDILILIFLYRYRATKTDHFEQLAPA